MASIIEHAKEIAELIKKYNDQDLYQRIVGLREEILQLRDENVTLRDEVNSLKRTKDIGGRLRREGNCYFLDDDAKKGTPILPYMLGRRQKTGESNPIH